VFLTGVLLRSRFFFFFFFIKCSVLFKQEDEGAPILNAKVV